jgi:sulfonate transport system permease protein
MTTATATLPVSPVDAPQVTRLVRRRRALDRRDIWLGLATPVLLLVLWQVSAMAGVVDTRIFTPPAGVFEAFVELVSTGQLMRDIGVSVTRLVLGFVLGSIGGIALGLVMGYFRVVRAALSPTMTALYALPKIAIIPLLLVIFGIGEVPRVLSVAIGTFFILLIATADAVRGLDPRIVEAGRAFRATGFALFWHVILRGSLPGIFTGLRLAAGIALILVTATEFVAANDGLGYLIWNSWTLFQPPRMYVGLLCAAILGLLFTALVSVVERLSLPWLYPGRRARRSRSRTRPTPEEKK